MTFQPPDRFDLGITKRLNKGQPYRNLSAAEKAKLAEKDRESGYKGTLTSRTGPSLPPKVLDGNSP